MNAGIYLVDHDRDDKIVRGPYVTDEAAAAVRRELENHDPYYSEEGNLWIVNEAFFGADPDGN